MKGKKLISMVSAMALAIGILAPAVAPSTAEASGQITANVPTVKDAPGQKLGTIRVEVDPGSVASSDSVLFRLPTDYDFANYDDTVAGTDFDLEPYADIDVVPGDKARNFVVVPDQLGSGADADLNGLQAGQISLERVGPREIKLTANADQSLTDPFVFFVYYNNIDIASGKTGEINATFEDISNGAFPSGTVTVGRTSTSGSVSLSVSGTDESNDEFIFNIRIREDVAGSLTQDDESLKFKLPSGYVWTDEGVLQTITGEDISDRITMKVDEEELVLDFAGPETNTASVWQLNGVRFVVDDESKVKEGPVVASVSGDTDTNVSSLTVGTYGDFGSDVDVSEVVTLVSGQDEQELGDIIVKESLGGTLVDGRTVTLELPSGARWQEVYEAEISEDEDDEPGDLPDFKENEGVELNFDGYTGTDDRTARFRVERSSDDDAAELKLEDVEVALEPGFEGQLVINVGGTAGVEKDLVVADVVTPVSVEVASQKRVSIGLAGQSVADFTITENVAGAIEDDESIILDLPTGVYFDGEPSVEVTSGDLGIGKVDLLDSDNELEIEVTSPSSEAATISFSDVKLRLDRTVAEGAINVEIKGDAVGVTSELPDWEESSALSFTIASVGTPAPGSTGSGNVANFVIGSTSYVVNGETKTMDVAPYIKDDRTYLPVRYVAESLGVDEDNILWNAVTKQVTILKGSIAIQLQIGNKNIVVNGVSIMMDVAPEIKDGRTMLPIRFVAQALGAVVEWDEATQTVTLK